MFLSLATTGKGLVFRTSGWCVTFRRANPASALRWTAIAKSLHCVAMRATAHVALSPVPSSLTASPGSGFSSTGPILGNVGGGSSHHHHSPGFGSSGAIRPLTCFDSSALTLGTHRSTPSSPGSGLLTAAASIGSRTTSLALPGSRHRPRPTAIALHAAAVAAEEQLAKLSSELEGLLAERRRLRESSSPPARVVVAVRLRRV
jgi:hypothetical protein